MTVTPISAGTWREKVYKNNPKTREGTQNEIRGLTHTEWGSTSDGVTKLATQQSMSEGRKG